LALLAFCCPAAADAPADVAAASPRSSQLNHSPTGPTPINRLLRLVDLPAGYEVTSDFDGSDGSCNEGPAPTGHHRVACDLTFGDNWRPAGISRPSEIKSVALRFDDVASAAAAFDARPDLVYDLFEESGDLATARAPDIAIGDDARIWSWEESQWATGAIVIWRWQHVIAMVHVTARSRDQSERVALRLAAIQQGRVSKLTHILPGENGDSEVALDSPRLQVPIRWLGRRFEPSGGLPGLDIFDSAWAYAGGEGPGWSAEILYVGQGSGAQVSLFRTRAWKRFKRGVIGKRIFGWSCTKPRRVGLADGWAAIRSTRDHPRKRCQKSGKGNHFFAVAHFRDVVATVNIPGCTSCVSGRDWGAFNTPGAMRAVVRGLQPRP
jgi:hypothetical protein